MKISTIQGIVENGQIRLPPSIHLPEKATVYVIIPEMEVISMAYLRSPRLVYSEQAIDFKKEVVEENPNAELR